MAFLGKRSRQLLQEEWVTVGLLNDEVDGIGRKQHAGQQGPAVLARQRRQRHLSHIRARQPCRLKVRTIRQHEQDTARWSGVDQ